MGVIAAWVAFTVLLTIAVIIVVGLCLMIDPDRPA